MTIRRLSWAILVLTLAACSTGVPEVTPTLAPTSTPTPQETRIADLPTRTPIIVFTETATVTATLTVSPTSTTTETASPTNTPTATATATDLPTSTNIPSTSTALPTDTPTPTITLTFTPTPTSTATHTATEAASPTPLFQPTATPSATETATATSTFTATPQPSVTPSLTMTPSATATLTPDVAASATRQAQLLATQQAELTPSPLPTWTSVPQPTATNTITIAAPTLDVTPTFITATPGSDLGVLPTVTPILGTGIPETAAPTATMTPFTPTALPPDRIPQLVTREPLPSFDTEFTTVNTDAFQFSVGEGGFIFNGQGLPGGVTLFAANPADANSYARTDVNGMLLLRGPGAGGEGQIAGSPFYADFRADSAETNKNYVTHLAWSPDGSRLAYVIQPPGGTDNTNAGVWLWNAAEPVNSLAVMHDCPEQGFTSCNLSEDHSFSHWVTETVYWSPDSTRMLLNVFVRSEGRGGIAVVNSTTDPKAADKSPGIWLYDSGVWLNNDQILVSGHRPSDGRVILGTVNGNIDPPSEQVIFDASANGLWIQDAVPRGGNYLALGKPGGPDGALMLYRIANGQATPISAPIGDAYPQQIIWTNNFAQVVVTVNGTQYLVDANGAISVPTVSGTIQIGDGAGTGGTGSGGIAPIGVREEPGSSVGVPGGVIEGSRYTPGQLVQYVGPDVRNLRSSPTVNEANFVDVVTPFEFVSILAGPVDADGFTWWQISNARNFTGWIAAESNGESLFVP